MKVLGVIPARFASTRFPGKPLATLSGKPMIQWVYENASKSSINKIVVATDDNRIVAACEKFGAEVQLTSPSHESGTDRCSEVLKRYSNYDVIINVQGDEPFVDPDLLNRLIKLFDNPLVDIVTAIYPLTDENELENPNVVKAIVSKNNKALCFTRSKAPFVRNNIETQVHYQHIGIYAYRANVLEQISALPQSPLELTESLEQLRWLENDYSIYCVETDKLSFGIDTPEDLEKAEKHLKQL